MAAAAAAIQRVCDEGKALSDAQQQELVSQQKQAQALLQHVQAVRNQVRCLLGAPAAQRDAAVRHASPCLAMPLCRHLSARVLCFLCLLQRQIHLPAQKHAALLEQAQKEALQSHEKGGGQKGKPDDKSAVQQQRQQAELAGLSLSRYSPEQQQLLQFQLQHLHLLQQQQQLQDKDQDKQPPPPPSHSLSQPQPPHQQQQGRARSLPQPQGLQSGRSAAGVAASLASKLQTQPGVGPSPAALRPLAAPPSSDDQTWPELYLFLLCGAFGAVWLVGSALVASQLTPAGPTQTQALSLPPADPFLIPSRAPPGITQTTSVALAFIPWARRKRSHRRSRRRSHSRHSRGKRGRRSRRHCCCSGGCSCRIRQSSHGSSCWHRPISRSRLRLWQAIRRGGGRTST